MGWLQAKDAMRRTARRQERVLRVRPPDAVVAARRGKNRQG
jgi:hypothetical protein